VCDIGVPFSYTMMRIPTMNSKKPSATTGIVNAKRLFLFLAKVCSAILSAARCSLAAFRAMMPITANMVLRIDFIAA
jgi:hypothetical protein